MDRLGAVLGMGIAEVGSAPANFGERHPADSSCGHGDSGSGWRFGGIDKSLFKLRREVEFTSELVCEARSDDQRLFKKE
ncbi:MAG TPA: hypothetical protein VKE96_03050 [Vicinamibacterales bacterium]|nr:hypothetical protein [Vicinamibacterales bacterium]